VICYNLPKASSLSDLMAEKGINVNPELFWTSSEGNDLIKKLNKYAQDNNLPDRIRREKHGPVVYAIVVNNFLSTADSDRWKLVKVGFTHQSIKKGDNNRMEQVRKEIESEIKELKNEASASILFAFPIGCVDTTSYYETEKRIRGKVGIPVKKARAKELKLPVPTEWVLTTQEHIDHIMKQKGDAYKSESSKDVIDIFKEIKAPTITRLPEWCKDWVQEEKSETKKNELNECHD